MSRKKGSSSQSLGKMIIKDRFAKKKQNRTADSFLHTSELEDGFNWGRLNLQSVTEQSQLDEFLMTAEQAGTDFTAEKLNIQVVSGIASGLPTAKEIKTIAEAQQQHIDKLKIPRRPNWHGGMSADELQSLERQDFLDWRRDLATLQDEEHILVTPFERNLEFWRQLWRVIERSDIVIQIVDARDPLLFRCDDLEKYVKEVEKNKVNVILINKSDFLTEQQRRYWANYFTEQGVKVFFWSALIEAEALKQAEVAQSNETEDDELDSDDSSNDEQYSEVQHTTTPQTEAQHTTPPQTEELQTKEPHTERLNTKEPHTEESHIDTLSTEEQHTETQQAEEPQASLGHKVEEPGNTISSGEVDETQNTDDIDLNTSTLYGASDLIEQIRLHAPSKLVNKDVLTIGLVGYPNVGKSSSLNAILQAKKCSVSATPGKTKHFQTIYLDQHTMLCDCPGLVMPSFVSSKAEMIVSGILPIDQMRDHKPASNLLAQRMGRSVLERTYGITIRRPREGEDPNRPPNDLEVLNAYGAMRGFMTTSGIPDCPRSARILLKDYVNGKLLYCKPPPGVSEVDFSPVSGEYIPEASAPTDESNELSQLMDSNPMIDSSLSHKLDTDFFSKETTQVFVNGKMQSKGENLKSFKKHGNKNKKEKTRRRFAHLDQHSAY